MKFYLTFIAIVVVLIAVDVALSTRHNFQGTVVGKSYTSGWDWLQMIDCGGGCMVPVWHHVPATYRLRLRDKDNGKEDAVSVSFTTYMKFNEGEVFAGSATLGYLSGFRYQ